MATTTTNSNPTTTPDPSNQLAAMEQALLAENLGTAIVLEDAYLSAGQDIAAAASKALRYDATKSSFVGRDTDEPVGVREWLRSRREGRPHWFKAANAQAKADPAEPKVASKPAGFAPDPQRPLPPGRPAEPTVAPISRVTQAMSEQEYAAYKRQNRHAKVLASSNVGGRRVLTVDCGSSASAQQVGGQSMDDYRKWRTAQGLGRKVGTA